MKAEMKNKIKITKHELIASHILWKVNVSNCMFKRC